MLESDSPLDVFVNVTSQFPVLASRLATLVPEVSDSLRDGIDAFQSMSPLAQRASFHLNGMHLPDKVVEPFALLRALRKERGLIGNVVSLAPGITGRQARELLADESLHSAMTGAGRSNQVELSADVLGDLFDAGDVEEGGDLILWWNDIEKDKKYAHWSKDLKEVCFVFRC